MQHRGMFALACLATGFAGLVHTADKPKRAVIEDTWIVAPQQLPGYALVGTVNYGDQGQLMAGVAMRYRDALAPQMTTDIYVYPAGGNQSLDRAEREFRDSVAMATALGAYADVRWSSTESFALKHGDGHTWTGRLITMEVRHKDGDYASRTYLFHHGIYDYKARIDMPMAAAAGFPAEADALVRAVLPTVQVISTGSCGKTMTVHVLKPGIPESAGFVDGVSPDGFDIQIRASDFSAGAADAQNSPLVARTLLAAKRQVASGCTALPFTPPASANVVVLKLHFPARFWASKPTASEASSGVGKAQAGSPSSGT